MNAGFSRSALRYHMIPRASRSLPPWVWRHLLNLKGIDYSEAEDRA